MTLNAVEKVGVGTHQAEEGIEPSSDLKEKVEGLYQTTDKYPDLLMLPDEILAKIVASKNYSEVGQVLRNVNQKLRDVTDSSLAAKLRFESNDSYTLQEIRRLLELYPEFRHAMPFTLDMSNSDITDDELEIIVEKFPNITAINAESCFSLSNIGLASLGSLPNLLVLNLQDCCKISNDVLESLGS
jgi:hypothetical protein